MPPGVVDVKSLMRRLDEAERVIENLQIALRSARRIGADVGILMQVRKIDHDAAFAVPAEASQRLNIKLRDVAEQVIYIGGVDVA